MKTKNGSEITLRDNVDGTIDLRVANQTIAFYNPDCDRWYTVGWVSEKLGLVRNGKGHEGYDPNGPVAFLP
jgi:hypothetical protein